jgi:Golgi phosphoprotein 3 (GPP34)
VLLAELFVLLSLDPDGTPARGYSNQYATELGVTGALIAELAQQGHLDLHDGRIHVTGTSPTHPLLVQVLENVSDHDGKKLKSHLSRIKHSGWKEVVETMIDDGKLGRDKSTLRPTHHPVLCADDQQALLARLRAAAISDVAMDDETASLLALAGPCQLLEVVAPDRADRTTAKRRIAEASLRVPAAAAVKYAVEAAVVVVIAAS